jgi:hypothetical protein
VELDLETARIGTTYRHLTLLSERDLRGSILRTCTLEKGKRRQNAPFDPLRCQEAKMVESEISALPSLELMRRLVALLPDGSSEQVQLFGVIKGLSTADFTGQFGGGKPWEKGAEGQARKVMRAILPKLSELLPGNPLVAELAKRYSAPGAKA